MDFHRIRERMSMDRTANAETATDAVVNLSVVSARRYTYKYG